MRAPAQSSEETKEENISVSIILAGPQPACTRDCECACQDQCRKQSIGDACCHGERWTAASQTDSRKHLNRFNGLSALQVCVCCAALCRNTRQYVHRILAVNTQMVRVDCVSASPLCCLDHSERVSDRSRQIFSDLGNEPASHP